MPTENISQKEQKEDYFVQATLNVADAEIPNVPCKIFLPDHITEKPLLKFKPTDEQYSCITRSHEGSLKAQLIGFDKKTEVSIFSPKVYFSNMETRYWGAALSESSFIGEPQHLQVVNHLKSEQAPQNTSLTLWITPNPMLGPAISSMHHYTGNIEHTRVRQLNFAISDKLSISFDKHFKVKEINKNEIKQWSYIVGMTEIDIPAIKVDTVRKEILPQIDDLLIIASLGSRTRTACIGWQASDHQDLVTYYRGEFAFPSGQSEPSCEQGLVWLKDFGEFLGICYPAFLRFSDQSAIRKAIISVVPGQKKVLEQSFLSMFAGLEALILVFRKEKELEFVVSDPTEWKYIKKIIKQNIFKSIKQELSKEQRTYIYTKLNELNQISLRSAFERFCKHYNIDLSDLWPLFKTRDIFGLSDIRNKLIHGDKLSDEFPDALWVAEENLRFMVERILVKILGFPVNKTEVSQDFLKKYSTALRMMHEEQIKISRFFSKQEKIGVRS